MWFQKEKIHTFILEINTYECVQGVNKYLSDFWQQADIVDNEDR